MRDFLLGYCDHEQDWLCDQAQRDLLKEVIAVLELPELQYDSQQLEYYAVKDHYCGLQ